MSIRIRFFFSAWMAILFSVPSLAQTPAEMQAWLKKNISIHYLAVPNTNDPQFKIIKPDSVIHSQNGIIFGKTDNGGMDLGAEFLTALFKDKTGDPKEGIMIGKDGDLKFQETVYLAMQLTGKPIHLYFVNDVTTGLQTEYMDRYKFHFAGNIMRWAVWPGSFPWKSPYAGAIVMGGFLKFDIRNLKEMFITLVAQVGLGDFGPAKKTQFFNWELNKGAGEFLFTFATNDIRRIANQGIANAFSLYYSDLLRRDFEKWRKAGGHYFLPMATERSGTDLSTITEIPEKYTLVNKLLTLNPKNKGLTYDEKLILVLGLTGNPVKAVFSDLFFFHEDKQRFRYALLNDLHLGSICYEFISRFGINKFVEMLKYNKGELITSPWEQKTKLIFQNMCLVIFAGRNDAALLDGKLPDGGKVVFGIALFDYYGYGDIRYPKGTFSTLLWDEFFKRTGGTNLASNEKLIYVIAHYNSTWQEKLREELKKTDSKGLDILMTGR